MYFHELLISSRCGVFGLHLWPNLLLSAEGAARPAVRLVQLLLAPLRSMVILKSCKILEVMKHVPDHSGLIWVAFFGKPSH